MSRQQIAIIPARGGSKRLPRKNILPINGEPMIAYPIRSALRSGLFDEVVVSTEDQEIGEIAMSCSATVLDRPDELAADHSTVVEVCTHVMNLPEYQGVGRFCCLYATAVFLAAEDICRARELMDQESVADYVMGVSTYNYSPLKALRSENGYLKSMWPEFQERKSQEFPELVVSNGTLYWAVTNAFLKDRTFYGQRLKGYQLTTVDIDIPTDYEKVRQLIEKRGVKTA